MQSNSWQVRSRVLASALVMGFFAADASAADGPVTTPPSPQNPDPTVVPKPSKPAKDSAIRQTTSPTPQLVSSESPKFGVYTPLASSQASTPSGQGLTAPGSMGGMGMGMGSMGSPGMMNPGVAGGASGMPSGAGGGTNPGATPPMGGGSGTGTAPSTGGSPAASNAATTEPFSTAGSASNSNADLPNIIGDFGPGVRISATPTAPGSPVAVPPPYKVPPRNDISSFIRVFKISENQSPRPQDRFFYTFNYFSDVNNSINRLDNSPITGIKIYRHVFGFEKTFDEGRGSVGFSLPLYNQQANSLLNSGVATPGSTALGDLNIFTKYILKENKKTGSLLSVGALFTPPTGTRYLAGANYFPTNKYPGAFVPVHDLQIQPFLGYIYQHDRFYVQGFSALNVAVAPQDVSFYFNDVQIGYFLFRDRDSGRFLTAIVPTFEAHISDPINHRGVQSPDPFKNYKYDPYGTPDTVNLTYGVNFEIRRNSVLTFAFAQPVTSYRPFNYEAILLFNYRFGRSRALVNPPPNVIGG